LACTLAHAIIFLSQKEGDTCTLRIRRVIMKKMNMVKLVLSIFALSTVTVGDFSLANIKYINNNAMISTQSVEDWGLIIETN